MLLFRYDIYETNKRSDENSICVALLHDTAEDTDIKIEDLEKLFPFEVIEAIKLLTHDKSIDYFDYILKIKENPLARKVKLADLRHNSDITRVSDKDIEVDITKYKKAIELLTD